MRRHSIGWTTITKWRDDVVITGSEDGDLVGVTVPSGKQLFRVRYNEKAQRGINNISVVGDLLLVANCAVGKDDKNIWLFDLSSGASVLSDSENLAVDLFRSQIFNFDADLVRGARSLAFFSSTEEGLLWMGRIDGGQMVIAGITKSSPEGGSVIDVSPSGNLIAVATYALRLRDRPASIADVWLSPDLARLSSNSVHKRPFTFVPIRVAEDRQCKGMYLLLDGHMRIQAMRELGATEVNCIVSTDDQGFTYNKRVNRLASPAASMVVRAQARETQ